MWSIEIYVYFISLSNTLFKNKVKIVVIRKI